MTQFQVLEVDLSPLPMLSRLLSLFVNGIGNIRKVLYDPLEATPGLKELFPLSRP